MPKIRPRPGGNKLGQEVRRLRLDLGWTQSELADRVGEDQADVSALERGVVVLPKQARVARYAEALGVTQGDLLEASGWVGAAAVTSLPVPTGAAKAQVVHLLDQMTEADARVLAMVADRFVKGARRRGDQTNHKSERGS